jgi:uncharacterized protein YoaH (UPF0181 family)
MANDKIRLEIDVDAKDAQAAIELFGKNATKVVSKTEKEFEGFGSSLKGSLGVVTAGFAAVTAGVFAFSRAIRDASDAEREIKALSFAIAGTGEFSKDAIDGLKEFADSLSELTTIDGGVIVSQLAVAKSFGITNEQAKNLVTAATNLAAVTGQDLESAVRQLGGTFDGTLGKIANLGPEFRNLTQEQIENGAAIDLLIQKYPDAAKALGDSFEGNLNRIRNQIKEVFTVIGEEIIRDTSLQGGLKGIVDGLKAIVPAAVLATRGLVELFKVFSTGFSVIVGGFSGVFADISEALGGGKLADSLRGISNASFDAASSLAAFKDNTSKADESSSALNKTLENVSKNAADFGNKASKSAIKAADAFKKAQDEAQKFISGLILNAGTEIEVAAKKAGDAFSKIDSLLADSLISEEQAAQARLAIVNEVNEKIDKSNQKLFDDYETGLRNQKEDLRKAAEEQQKLAGLGLSIGQSVIAGGDEQAQKRNVGSAITAGVSAIPGAGQFLGPIASLASSIAALSKEQAKEFAKGFARAVPEFVIALVDNIPEIVEGFIEVLSDPGFWKRVAIAFSRATVFALTGGLAKFVQDAVERIGPAIAEKISSGFNDFFDNFGSVFENLFANIGAALESAFTGLANSVGTAVLNAVTAAFRPIQSVFIELQKAFQPLTDALNALKDNVDKIGGLGGSGGGRGVIAETLGRAGISFSTGGVVPKYAANGMFVPRGTDTVPAMLTPGELVVPTDLVGQLAAFLSMQDGSNGVSQDTAILTAILQAVQSPTTVQTQVKVNQSAFADIILQLNRQNSRLSA